MHLDYRLHEGETSDWSSVTEEDLRYRVALGDLIFRVGEKDFSAAWGWIPLVDLAASFSAIARKLASESVKEAFEFTESDAWIRFERKADQVIVSASYQPDSAETTLHKLTTEIERFSEKLAAELTAKHPTLSRNQDFHRLLR